MWPFKSVDEKAKKFPPALVSIVAEISPHFVSALYGGENRDKEKESINREILAFSLHLTDRIVYSLGTKDRDIFMDNLILEMEIMLRRANVASVFDYYDKRIVFYSKFIKTSYSRSEPPGGTLCFEFGKSLVSLYGEAKDEPIWRRNLAGEASKARHISDLAVLLYGFITEALVREKIVTGE